LAERIVDIKPFIEKMGDDCLDNSVTSFFNLGHDAMLIIPCFRTQKNNEVVEPPSYMTHFSSFIKSANTLHISNLWSCLGSQVLQLMQNTENNLMEKIWISTSGLGVSWLHIRLDSFPKYHYDNYKIA
jgi:hypothetical protein